MGTPSSGGARGWGPGRARVIACYPGTFDPPTVAHLAIASAALEQGGVDHIDLVVSVSPLGKSPSIPTLEHRLAVLEEVAANRSDLGVRTSEHRLIADVAAGYDALVLGADKWLQVTDPSWYDSTAARDAAVASLPRLLLVGRAGAAVVPPAGCALLDVDPGLAEVSSSSARAGRREWMAPEAAAFDELTGAWSDPARYLRWSSAE